MARGDCYCTDFGLSSFEYMIVGKFEGTITMAEEVGVEPTRHPLGISTALKAARLTGDVALPNQPNFCP